MDNKETDCLENEKSSIEDSEKYKLSKLEMVKQQISKMNLVVKNLENSFAESEEHDKQLVMALRMDNMKSQRLASQLEEARKENKQILNVLQQQCHDNEHSRSSSRSQMDLSCSTMSMVHLQYKYEELMSSHEGLLKVLESRVKEVQKAYTENNQMRDEIENLSIKQSWFEKKLKALHIKYQNLKMRKDKKIWNLRSERNTLRVVHNQLVNLLSKQCLEQDKCLIEQLSTTHEPTKALLLTEVRKTNQLHYENAKLKQEIAFLQSQLEFTSNDDSVIKYNYNYNVFENKP